MTAPTAAISNGPSGRHPTVRRRRRWLAWFIALLMIATAGVAVALIITGSRSIPPPPAPVPEHPYSAVRPPAALLPGDVVPPATGAVTAADPTTGISVGAPAGTAGPGDTRSGQPNGSRGGGDSTPPHHIGPWTFDGADRLFVQSLGIDAPILPVGTDRGALIIPADVRQVGRWTGGADIDDQHGTVLIAGHVNFVGQGEGALYNLYTIQPGAVIVTTDSKAVRTSWRVIALDSINKKALPTDIFTRTGPRRLVLVTCGGNLLHIDGPNGGYNTYQNNTLAYAIPAT